MEQKKEILPGYYMAWLHLLDKKYHYPLKAYAFTVSPKDWKLNGRYLHSNVALMKTTYKSFIDMQYIVEKSKNGKVHAHGLVVMRSPVTWKRLGKGNLLYYYDVQPVVDGEGWVRYMLKDKPTKGYDQYAELNYPMDYYWT